MYKTKHISVPDAYDDNRFNPSVDKNWVQSKSILCAPILNAGDKTVIGVLQAINKVAEHTDVFSKDDITAAQQYCSHLARAVENCQRTQSGKEELLQSSMEIKKFTVNVAASLAEMKIEETQSKKKPSSPLKGLARFRNAAKRVAEEEKKKNQEKSVRR